MSRSSFVMGIFTSSLYVEFALEMELLLEFALCVLRPIHKATDMPKDFRLSFDLRCRICSGFCVLQV